MPISTEEALGVPPDGAGKKIQVGRVLVVDYTAAVASPPFLHGQPVEGSSSGVVGTVINVRALNSTQGVVEIFPNPKDAASSISTFLVGEDLRLGSVRRATVASITAKYVSQTVIAGGSDPANFLSVDEQGGAHVRFADGNPSLDLMGAMTASEAVLMGNYTSQYEDDERTFSYLVSDVAGHAFDAVTSSVRMTVGATAGTIVRRTNWTHYYQQGATLTSRMGLMCPDPAKTHVDRRWGLYDDGNGVFWGIKDGVLGVGHRSDSTGSPVETFIPQDDWNVDRLDGSGGPLNLSAMTIDPGKINLYWVEYRWYGTARIRFGIFIDDIKIVAHEVSIQNMATVPAFRYGSFPLSFEIATTAPPGSTTEMAVYAASVHSSALVSVWTDPGTAIGEPRTIPYTDGFVPLISMRAADLYHNIKNDVWAGLMRTCGTVLKTDHSGPEYAIFKAVYASALTGASWSSTEDSSVEVDTSATHADYEAADEIGTWMVAGNSEHIYPAASVYDADGVGLNADGSTNIVTILARPLNPATSVSASAVLYWEELK